MGTFDDPNKLADRTFPWGLGRYRSDLPEDSPPPDLDAITVYVDEEGIINVDGELQLHRDTDPLNAPVEATYSPDNLFVSGLRRAIGPFPLYGTLVIPHYDLETGSGLRYPDDVPADFVVCAGQIITFKGGTKLTMPNLVSVTSTGGAGDGAGTTTTYFAPPGFVYLMKVPEGRVREVKRNVFGREEEIGLGEGLGTYGTPKPVSLF